MDMKNYKVYVNGVYIGSADLTPAEVSKLNNDTSIILSRNQAHAQSMQDGNLHTDDDKPHKILLHLCDKQEKEVYYEKYNIVNQLLCN